jgi:hypothetical protein
LNRYKFFCNSFIWRMFMNFTNSKTNSRQFSKIKLLASAAAFLALGAIFFTACESGVGVEDGLSANSSRAVGAPIPITSAAELEKIGTDDDDYPIDGEYVLAADLVLSNWEPVPVTASGEPAFTGTFDGAGHTITLSSFSKAATGGTNAYLGLFRQISDGQVSNLTVILALGTVSPTSTPNAAYFGGVTGSADSNTTFSHITITGNVDIVWNVAYTTYGTGFLYVGGISGDNTNVVISNSHKNGTISASTTVQGSSCYVGGLIGRGDVVTLDRCTNEGLVKGNGPGYNSSVGGIAGYITQSTVTYSRSEGQITLYASSSDFENNLWQAYGGGLVGYSGNGSRIEKCSALYGNVFVEAPYPYAGGLVGYNYGVLNYPNPPSNGSKIFRSESDKTVLAQSQGASGGLPYAGGLVGYSSATGSRVENCFATGDVSATTQGTYSWAGGLAGANANNSVISKCYATGAVDVQSGNVPLPYGQPGINPGAAAGGIAAVNYYTEDTRVEHCAALNPSITGTASPAVYLLHRVVGDLGTADSTVTPPIELGTLFDNIAYVDMSVTPVWTPDKGLNRKDGEDVTLPVSQIDFTDLGWDFDSIWEMGAGGLPELQ